MYLGDYTEDATVDFKWSTVQDGVGSVTRATNGTVSVYPTNSTTQITTGVTDTEDFDSVTGVHHCRIDLSASASYAVGQDYQVVVTGMVIGGQTINAVIAHFSIENRFDEVDVTQISGAAVSTSSAQLGVNVVNAAGTAWNSGSIGAATLASNTIAAAKIASGAITSAKFASGAITATVIAADAIGASELASDAAAEIAGAVWEETQSTHTSAGTFGEIATEIASILDDTGSSGVVLAGTPSVNAVQISGDSTAADNLEAMYDGTGYTDATAPSSRSQVDAIGAASGGSLNFEATSDNASSPIKSVSSAGTQTGTYTNTEAEDGTYHQITAATNDIDWIYGFNIGGARTAVEVTFKGYLSGSNDDAVIQAYDFVGADWETIATIAGQAGTSNITITAPLLSKHTGTGSDLGNVYIRIDGQNDDTTPVLFVDQLVVAGVNIGQSVGYALGAIWVDTNNGTSGTEAFVNGVADNPVDTWANALSLASSVGLSKFIVAPGSSITLTANSDNYEIIASGATVALGGQSVSGAIIRGASITGNDDGSNANATTYFDCIMGNNTLGLHRLSQCGLSGTITIAEAGTYDYAFCFSEVAGTGTPVVDTGDLVGNVNLNMRHYSGGVEVQELGSTGTDNMSLEGNGQLVVAADCAGGTIAVRGNFRITDNSSGAVNIVATIPTISQTHQGTAQSGTANTITLASTASATDGTYDPSVITIISGTGAGQARNIIDYNGTTKVAVVDRDWRVNPDSSSSYVIVADSGSLHVNEGLLAGATSTTATLNSSGSSTDDIYIGQTLFIVGGTGQDQARIITDYNGTTKVATVHKAWTTTPSTDSSYVMLPLPTIGDNIANLTFTQSGVVDANIEYVNGTQVTGSGTDVDPWGP